MFLIPCRSDDGKFILKKHMETELVLRALKSGFTVLSVWVDTVFVRDPIPVVQALCGHDVDILIQHDPSEVNTTEYTYCITVKN